MQTEILSYCLSTFTIHLILLRWLLSESLNHQPVYKIPYMKAEKSKRVICRQASAWLTPLLCGNNLQLVTSKLDIKPFTIKCKEYLWVKFFVKLNTNLELLLSAQILDHSSNWTQRLFPKHGISFEKWTCYFLRRLSVRFSHRITALFNRSQCRI